VDKHVDADGSKCTGKAETEKFVEGASAALWKSLADEAVGLWTKIYSLSDKVTSTFSGLPAGVTTPLLNLLSHIFEVQVRGFNSIRVRYTRKLKVSLGESKDHDGVKAASRTALRDAIFETVNILAEEHWVKTHEALTEAAKAYVCIKFTEEVWPSIKEGLDALLELIPDELKKLGLDIAGTVLKVAIIIINKGVAWAMAKIGLRMETAIFSQEEGYSE